MQVLFLIAYAVLGAKLYITVIESHMFIVFSIFQFWSANHVQRALFFLSSQDKIMQAMYV